MKGTQHTAAAFVLALAASIVGCADRTAARSEARAELAPYRASEIPADARRTFVDFGGKLHLVAVSVSPSNQAGPVEAVTLTLYWKPVMPVPRGYALFTHLQSEGGRQLANYDNEGAFRGWLKSKMPEGMALLEPGRVYVDEQTLTMPKAEALPERVTLVVGAWRDSLRLPIVSGAHDGQDAAVLAHFSTGVKRPRQAQAPRR